MQKTGFANKINRILIIWALACTMEFIIIIVRNSVQTNLDVGKTVLLIKK